MLLGLLFFVYFYFFESPTLLLAQHRLSGGLTSYEPLIGALLLSTLFVFLQSGIARLLPLPERLYLVSALPSVALALLLTAFTPETSVFSIVLAVICFLTPIICVVRGRFHYYESPRTNHSHRFTTFSHHLQWLLIIALALGCGSNSNDLTTYEVLTAEHLLANDSQGALRVGQEAGVTSWRLTALRAFALSKEGDSLFTALPERLLDYPLPAEGAPRLLLDTLDYRYMRLPADSLYRHLGAFPAEGLKELRYLTLLQGDNRCTHEQNVRARDYLLCLHLLRRDLDSFAEIFQEVLPITTDSALVLPRLYRQALVLYADNHPQEDISQMADSATRSQYEAYRQALHKPSFKHSASQLLRDYGQTYWWYYDKR
ncbi:MAG: DUF6057 family protein [Alloprevotella sp.]|nr:DUF6057 family protein [Alloprevotella sp.]MDY4460432.1 DUF6057 family protein [Alloprevotella sp.]